MINLPTKKRAPIRVTPAKLLLFGPTKVGKTSQLALLENNLIIDTEEGTEELEAMSIVVRDPDGGWRNSIRNLNETIAALRAKRKEGFIYDYITLDTLDNVVEWYEKYICAKYKVAALNDLEYGKGHALVRDRVMQVIHKLKSCTPHLILVGHVKKTLLGSEDEIGLTVKNLDLPGKLKNLVSAEVNAIGLMYRDAEDDSKLMVSFKSNEELEAGTRTPYLTGKVIEFNWDTIFPPEETKKAIIAEKAKIAKRVAAEKAAEKEAPAKQAEKA